MCVCACAPKVLFIACFVPVESTSTKPGFSRFALAFWKVPCLNTKFCLEPSEPQVFWRTTQTRNRPRPLDVTRDRLQTLVEEHVAKNFWELLKRRWRFWKSWSSDRRIVGFCAHRVVYVFVGPMMSRIWVSPLHRGLHGAVSVLERQPGRPTMAPCVSREYGKHGLAQIDNSLLAQLWKCWRSFIRIVFPTRSEPQSIVALKAFGRFAKRSTRNVKTGQGQALDLLPSSIKCRKL